MAKTDKPNDAPAAPAAGAPLVEGEALLLSAEPSHSQVLLAAALAAFPHHLARTPERPATAALDAGEAFAAEWVRRHATQGGGGS